jgi:hypothetical protein
LLPADSLKLKEGLSLLVQNASLFKNISLSNGNQTTSALNDLNATLSGKFLIYSYFNVYDFKFYLKCFYLIKDPIKGEVSINNLSNVNFLKSDLKNPSHKLKGAHMNPNERPISKNMHSNERMSHQKN